MRGMIRWGSHLPVLMTLVPMTTGPIVELGSGYASTQFLHWACFPTKRRLVTYENSEHYYRLLKQFACEWHEMRLVDDWDAVDLSEPWSIALVDHAPAYRRPTEMARLGHAEYVVAHDTERRTNRTYRYSEAPKFKYAHKYRAVLPHTSIFSNIHTVSGLMDRWPILSHS